MGASIIKLLFSFRGETDVWGENRRWLNPNDTAEGFGGGSPEMRWIGPLISQSAPFHSRWLLFSSCAPCVADFFGSSANKWKAFYAVLSFFLAAWCLSIHTHWIFVPWEKLSAQTPVHSNSVFFPFFFRKVKYLESICHNLNSSVLIWSTGAGVSKSLPPFLLFLLASSYLPLLL